MRAQFLVKLRKIFYSFLHLNKHFLWLILFTFFCSLSFAQHPTNNISFSGKSQTRTCGTMQNLDMLYAQDSGLAARMQLIEAHVQQYLQNNPINASNSKKVIITIPTVFHVVYNNGNENIPDAQVMSQLDVLNEDFRRLNADAVNTPSQYLPIAADVEIQFCLATRDPNGSPTTGITRTASSHGPFSTNNDMKFTANGGIDAWPCNEYLNFWICNFSGGLLGYAQFPGGSCNTDGIVCLYTSVGRPPDNPFGGPFNLGRTATHEVGHWLNLRHIWGDGPCGNDDFVADTPESDAANYGCPTGHVSCGDRDMVENYMDYTDDACMNIFTLGQKARMQALFSSGGVREQLASSLGCTPLTSLDAGIAQIISPASGSMCADSIFPVVLLQNYGGNTLTSCDIIYQLDGGPLNTWAWTGSLATGTNQNISLPAEVVNAGAHTYTAYTNNPNGGTDQNNANDLSTTAFTISVPPVGIPVPFFEGFELTNFPPANWTLQNGGNTNYTWVRTTAASGFGGSTASAFMDNFSPPSPGIAGDRDALITPTIDFSGVIAPVVLDFRVAYVRYNGTYQDQLDVTYSVDCGNTWNQIYNKSGTALATAADQTTAFTPANSEWRQETNNIDVLAGQTSVIFKFENISGWGNNLYLDDINLYGATPALPPVANFFSDKTVICAGESITFTDSSTNMPSSWNWTFNGGTPGTSNLQNPVIVFNTAGTYDVTLTATNLNGGDTQTKSLFINVNPNPSTNISGTDPSCNGVCNGIANLTPSSGTMPYTYNWSNSATTEDISNLCAGNFLITVSDANNCTAIDSVTLTNLSSVNGTIVGTDASCSGICNGSTNLTVVGGTNPYTYSWSNGDISEDLANICAGTYLVTISDINGCLDSSSIAISNSTNISSNIVGTDANCNGIICDGGANLVISGGSNPYTFAWSNGSTSQNINSLCPATFFVTITDINGCQILDSVTISQMASVNTGIVETNVPCDGSCVGATNLTVNSGTNPFTFNWSNGSTTEDLSSLCAGLYIVTVTDINGCIAIDSAVVSNNFYVSAGNDTAICLGSSASLNGSFALADTGSIVLTNSNNFSIPDNDDDGNNYNTGFGATSDINVTGFCSPTITAGMIESVCLNIQHPKDKDLDIFLACPDGTWIDLSTDNGGSNPDYTNTCFTPNSVNDITTGNAPFTGDFFPQGNFNAFNGCPTNGLWSLNVQDDKGGSTGTLLNWTITFKNDTCISWSPGLTLNDSTIINPIATPVNTTTYTLTVSDNHGCVSSDSVIVEVSNINISATSTDVSCFGGSDGTANALPSGGISPYSYLWGPPAGSQTTSTATGLSMGTYNITVTDFIGCTALSTTNINEPPLLSINADSTNVSCNGGNDGTTTANVSGGTGPYSYLWNDLNAQTSIIATGLTSGSYNVSITDANGCTTLGSTFVNEPSAISISMNSTDVSCNGGNNGTATANPVGGTGAYTYLWDINTGSQTTASAIGLIAGSYSITVTDNNNCTSISSVTINESTIISLSLSSTDATCGGFDGTSTANPSGGLNPYTFIWNDINAQTTATATGLVAGIYTVTVTDNGGCSIIDSILVSNIVPTIVLSSTSTTCFGGNDGTASVTANGGNLPYTYQWNDLGTQSTAVATGLFAGTYTVLVIDNIGCFKVDSIIVSQPPEIITIISSISASCNGASDGSATAITTGGTGAFTYLWNDISSQTNITATGLNMGTYIISITDNNGCIDTTSVFVNEPIILGVSTTSVSNTCFGGNDGSATAIPSGGTSPYTYLWNDIGTQSGATAIGLSFGYYTVIISDNNNCSTTDSILVQEPTAIVISISSISANCGQSNGSVTANPSGGAGSYTYLWNDLGSQTTATAIGLPAGSYNVTVTDMIGCIMTDSVIISNLGGGIASAIADNNVTCNGLCDGQATVSISGGSAPFTYSWNSFPVQTNATAIGLCSGIYTASILDAIGCLSSASVTISEPSAISSSFTAFSDATCNGNCDGSTTVSVVGGVGPYSYLWNDPGNQTNAIATALCASTVTITITDNNNCLFTDSVTINEPLPLASSIIGSNTSCNGGNDGSANLSTSGGTGPYTYLWMPGSITSEDINLLTAGIYTVTITDLNGCNLIDSISISEPTLLSASIIGNDALCNGSCDGDATVFPNGGVGIYTYLWDDPGSQTNASATGLCAGIVNVTITDENLCSTVQNFTISEPTLLSVSTTGNDALCNGNCDGNATVIATGGTGNYTYSWDDPLSQTSSNATGLCAGNYLVNIIDANGCTNSGSQVVNEPLAMSFIVSSIPATCGSSDGQASVAVSGGFGPYNYVWNDPASQTNGTATGLLSNVYVVIITDNNGCIDSTTALVSNTVPLVSITNSNNATCSGTCDGSSSVSASGGLLPYTYSWDDPGNQTNATATGLCAGVYIVSIIDGNGCTAFASDTIYEPQALSSLISSIDVLCFGDANGSLTINVSGGLTPYTFLWDSQTGNQNTTTAINLAAGTYNVTINDASGCILIESGIVIQPFEITSNIISTDISCAGNCNGSATVSVNGGIGAYNYIWDDLNAQTNATANLLCAGNYSVIISDSNNCFDTASTSILEPLPLSILTSGTNETCNATCDGTAMAIPSGGSYPYSYSWSTKPTSFTAFIDSLCPDTLTITVTDSLGCIDSSEIIIGGSVNFSLSTTGNNETCIGNCDGDATVTITGGIGPFNYSWDDPLAQTNATATSLCASTYLVTIIDSAGCMATANYSLTEPDGLSLSSSSISANCGNNNGSAIISVIGGISPYNYSWNTIPVQTNASATGLSAGTYAVNVTDSNNCSADTSVIILDIGSLNIILSGQGISCNGLNDGSTSTSVLNGTAPFTYLWNDIQLQTNESATGLSAGIYSVIVLDNNNCSFIDSVEVLDMDSLHLSTTVSNVSCTGNNDGKIDLLVSGGTPPYSYNWLNIDTSQSISNLTEDSYIVIVSDSNNCNKTKTIIVGNYSENCLSIPTGFTPNSDGTNDIWNIKGIENETNIVVEVFNRWGSMVFSSKGYSSPWDGTYEGKELPIAVYYYIISIEGEVPKTGTVTIFR